jgi:uncharacterized protein YjiS (DUF1127 family)
MRAHTQFKSGDDHLRLGAIFSLPATWWQRACFRVELRADIRDKPDFLRDIGIGLHEAQAEASRFFWEPLLLNADFLHSDHLPGHLFYLGPLGTRADAEFSQRTGSQITALGIAIAVAGHDVRHESSTCQDKAVLATLQNYDTM